MRLDLQVTSEDGRTERQTGNQFVVQNPLRQEMKFLLTGGHPVSYREIVATANVAGCFALPVPCGLERNEGFQGFCETKNG
jgi:hypothetical protein